MVVVAVEVLRKYELEGKRSGSRSRSRSRSRLEVEVEVEGL